MKISAIVPAAGSAQRMGGSVRKQFMTLLGQPLFLYTLRRLAASPLIGEIILAAPREDIEPVMDMVTGAGFSLPIKVVAGGDTRQKSVANGFGHTDTGAELVLVHDGVRPFVTQELIQRVAHAAEKTGSAVTACRARDTLKRIRDGRLGDAIPRDDAVHIQTPQCFRYSILAQALDLAEREDILATDESSLVQRMGMDVAVVDAPFWNIKITTAEDMILADALARHFAAGM
jgi:2-C-methyl-D-erythritol 4-phosphate cytidylyltransferase